MSEEKIERAVRSKGTADMPPAGHEQREVLKRRQASLEEEADALAEQMIMGEVDPKALEIDNEIASRVGQLDVSAKRDDMHYVWTNYVSDHGNHVERKRLCGWEIVSGKGPDVPEARELIKEDGTRRIGDVLLMRIPRDHALVMMAKERKRALERRGILRNPEALAEMALRRTNGKVKIHLDLSEEHRRTVERRATARRIQMETAMRQLGKKLEGGAVINPRHFSGRT